MLSKLQQSAAWKYFQALAQANRTLAWAWWTVLVLRGLLPAAFAIAMGVLVHAVQHGTAMSQPLAGVALVFLLLQVLSPLHQAMSANLGNQTAIWLYGQLTRSCLEPPGLGHLEDPKLTADLTMARDFDLGIAGPPLFISMGFIASGLVEMIAGIASALVLAAYAWWPPLVLGGVWAATHWLLRESAVWRDRNTEPVRAAQRHADYAYRLAVDPPAAKELRLFGLAEWVVERFRSRRRTLFHLQWEATRLRERPVIWSLLLVLLGNALVFGAIAADAAAGRLDLARLITFATAAVGTSLIAFGGLSWALDSASAPVHSVLRLREAMQPAGALKVSQRAADRMPANELRFRQLKFAYPNTSERVLDGVDLTIPAGTSLAIVGQNGAGKTTMAKLLCRLYDPQSGSIEVDGVDLRELDLESWRTRVTAVFQDFIRFELSLRENVAPTGAPDEVIQAALADAGAGRLTALETPLTKGAAGGTDLSGGQWQRIALARALCAVKLGAGVVLLDEPTAQLDVRGEAEIFDRILKATRHTTTILISHRFSTVRHADRICVLEHGRVIELGSHDELMRLGGRYSEMFQMQASRFNDEVNQGESLAAAS